MTGRGGRIAGVADGLRRRGTIAADFGVGVAALARARTAGRAASEPAVSNCWVPAQALLARRGLIGATSPQERAFCEWYTRVAYRGAGAIVDLGAWLGSTTVPLARGLARRGRGTASTRVQAYDRFVWEAWMSEFTAASGQRLAYRPGDDFRPALETALDPYRRWVDVHTADLRVERWTGGPIELAVVDAMKSWELARNILQEFLSAVIPGGIVFHQDFAHYFTPWIHLIGYRLREHLEVYYDVRHSDAVAFRVRAPLTGLDASLTTPESYAPEEAAAAFTYARGLVGADKHADVTAAEAMFHLHRGDPEEAAAVIRRARDLRPRGDLEIVERLLQDAGRSGTPWA